MRTFVTRAAVIGVLALALAPGCSSMEKRWDEISGKSGRADRSDRIELNSAGRKRLAALPGLSGDDADRIVANRPYDKRRDLVSKGVLSQAKFDRVRDDVYVDHDEN